MLLCEVQHYVKVQLRSRDTVLVPLYSSVSLLLSTLTCVPFKCKKQLSGQPLGNQRINPLLLARERLLAAVQHMKL